jgi:hypothetical protein
MASRVLDLVRDPGLLAATGARARQRAVERMSLGDTIAGIARLLTRLAQARHDARRIAEVARDGELLDGTVAPNDKAALA